MRGGNTIISAPDALRDTHRHPTRMKQIRMKQIRTWAAWRPDMTAYREMDVAYRIALKSLARRYLELHDEVADLDAMIKSIVDELRRFEFSSKHPASLFAFDRRERQRESDSA